MRNETLRITVANRCHGAGDRVGVLIEGVAQDRERDVSAAVFN